jgi:hypothetical protein
MAKTHQDYEPLSKCDGKIARAGAFLDEATMFLIGSDPDDLVCVECLEVIRV